MTRLNLAPLLTIFERDVVAERWRQLKKWGPQSHPDGTGLKGSTLRANLARERCQKAHDDGVGTWEHILSEKVFEAFAESEYTSLRKELIEVATVALAWVEDLDNRAGVPAHPLDELANLEPGEDPVPEDEKVLVSA